MGGGGQGVGALYDHRCTRRAAMHEKGFDALGAFACTWWSSVQLEKLDALGKLRCTWRPLSAEKTVARCIEVREVHGGFRNAPKLNACIEDSWGRIWQWRSAGIRLFDSGMEKRP